MSTQAIPSANNVQELSMSYEKDQYTLWQILGIWALVSLPMALLIWVGPFPPSSPTSRCIPGSRIGY